MIRFIELTSKLGLNEKPAIIINKIIEAYSSEERRYHNLNHIANCLTEFEHARSIAKNPQLIEYAVWFHDYEYDIFRKDNEEKSLDEALKYIPDTIKNADTRKQISGLILSTKQDRSPQTIDEKIIIDLDLSTLGKKPEVYNQYKEHVYEEYKPAILKIGKECFLEKRKVFLKSMLARESIYYTDIFKDLYEESARKNLADEIKEINKK